MSAAHGWKVGTSVYCGWCADMEGAEEIEAPEGSQCAECGAIVKGDERVEINGRLKEREDDECAHGRYPDDCDDCIAAENHRPPFCPHCHGEHAPYCRPEEPEREESAR